MSLQLATKCRDGRLAALRKLDQQRNMYRQYRNTVAAARIQNVCDVANVAKAASNVVVAFASRQRPAGHAMPA